MCLAPQRRALFRHLNFQMRSEREMFFSFFHLFSLAHALCATTACTFSTSQLPKSGPDLVCFVHFDFQMCFAPQRRAICHLSSGQMAPPAALASLLFDPPEPQIIRKTECFRDFPTFSRICIFFLLTLSLL